MKRLLNFFRTLFFQNKLEKNKRLRPLRPLTDEQFNQMKINRQKKLDLILDKILEDGYDGLSNHEKNFLDNYGQE